MTVRLRKLFHDLTTEDLKQLDRESTVAVLTVGATEQHGPHLPLTTDTIIGEGIVAAALVQVSDKITALAIPTMPFGDSIEHIAYPGTISLEPQTLFDVWLQIGESVARAGLLKLVIFNSHGGQIHMVDSVAKHLRVKHDMLVVKANYMLFDVFTDLFDAGELQFGLHGGAVETSIMLHLRPDLVRMDKAENFKSSLENVSAGHPHLNADSDAAFSWSSQDLNPAGVCGDATQANADLGRMVVERASRILANMIEEAATFSLASLNSSP
jgi:creatinine amidohydrolase